MIAGEGPPRLLAVVDTEEEFDWNAPFDRARRGVGHLRAIGRLQEVFEAWGVRPVYCVTHPVATDPAGIAALRPIAESGRALVGAHLHPWVTPPDEEEVCVRNSFAGNLPPRLERAKLAALARAVEGGFGARPTVFKAGRYGLGPHSFANLEAEGFEVDLSPAPPFDYSAEGGPDFSARGLAPRWEGPREAVLSVPGTGALVGRLPDRRLHAAARRLSRLRAAGILARLGVVERLKLSPEEHGAADLTRLARFLLRHGRTRLLSLSLHSPSVEAGHTPYAPDEAGVRAVLAALDGFLRAFFRDLGGAATDPLSLLAEARAARGGNAAIAA